eukprot:gene4279-4995_t
MDALDGKQARRTGSSSGLGELFDHGCDAITTFLVCLTFLTSVQAGVNTASLLNLMLLLVAFYFTQWEQYHTGVMELGHIGVTEGQISVMICHLISYVFGPSIWLTELSILGYTFTLNFIPIAGSSLAAIYTLSANIGTVVKKGPKSVRGSIFQLIPILFIFGTAMRWGTTSTILYDYPHTFMVTFGFLISFLVGRIVLARICCDEFHPFQIVLLPLLLHSIFGAQLFQMLNITEGLFIQIYCAITMVVYLHFANVVVTSLCNVLEIHCFKLKNTKKY